MKKTIWRGLALLSALLMLCGMTPYAALSPLTANAAESTTGGQTKIACIGASTTFGAGADAGNSWPDHLQRLVGGLCDVRNFGVNSRTVIHNGTEQGDTSQQLAYTLTGEYKSSLAFKADVVLIMMGGNDAKPVNWKDGNNTFEADYKKLVQAYQKANPNAQVVVVIEPWVRQDGSITEAVMENGVRPAYTKVAAEMNLPTIDLYTPTKGHTEWYSDGVHGNNTGYLEMAKVVAARLKELNLIPEGSEDTPIPFRPSTSVGDFYGTFDGYDVMQWKNGATGNFQFTAGTLAAKMGITKETVVKNLTIDVSYYWDYKAGGNDWWHFNTWDKNGESAPSATDPTSHDSGFGKFSDYGMTGGKWQVLTVSRENQRIGGKYTDWYVGVGNLDAKNSLYIRGYKVTATMQDDSVKSFEWGAMRDRRGADDGKTLKIACVGASTTEGTKGHSYPAYLKMILGNNCEVKNFGYPGASVTKGRQWSYIDGFHTENYQRMYKDSLAYKADVVIIDIGGNDAQADVWGRGTFSADYEELVNAYRNQGNDPLIMITAGTYMYPNDTLSAEQNANLRSMDTMLTSKVIPAMVAVAEKYDIPVFDLRGMLMTDPAKYIDAEDGVHYTAAGYKTEAEEIAKMLLPLVNIPASGETDPDAMIDPVDMNIPIKDYDGYRCLAWENGTTGGFSYSSGALAFALGIDAGTVVKELSITFSYYYNQKSGGDWWWFNTTDENGESAPALDDPVNKPHDNGFGTLDQYGLKKGSWNEKTVTRTKQMLGRNDWSVTMGSFGAKNSLYIRGFVVTATLDDGSVKTAQWGTMTTRVDRTALDAAIADEVTDLSGYTDETVKAYTEALTAAKAVAAKADATQEEIDAATKALTDAKAALKRRVDRTALDAAIADEVTDLSGYTDETVKAYTEALTAAKAVAAKADATQEEIDAATKALTDAKAALVAKSAVVYGDVNGDGVVDTADAVLVLQRAAKLIDDNALNIAAADVNGDNVIDTADAVLILQKAAKLIEKFPVEK